MGNVPEVLSRDGSDSYLSVFLSNASFSGILNGGMIEQDDTSNGPMMPLQHTAPTEQNINDVPRGDAILRGRNEEDILTQALRINQDRAARFETLTRNEGLKKPYQQSRTFVKEVSKCYRTRSKRSISERKRNDMCIIDLLGLRKDQDFWRVMDRVNPAQYLTDNDRIAIKRFLAQRSNTHSETLARAEMEIEVAGELSSFLIRPGVNNAQLMGLEKICSTIRKDRELFLFYRDCFCQDKPKKTEYRDAWIAHFKPAEPLLVIPALPDLDLDDATASEGGSEEDDQANFDDVVAQGESGDFPSFSQVAEERDGGTSGPTGHLESGDAGGDEEISDSSEEEDDENEYESDSNSDSPTGASTSLPPPPSSSLLSSLRPTLSLSPAALGCKEGGGPNTLADLDDDCILVEEEVVRVVGGGQNQARWSTNTSNGPDSKALWGQGERTPFERELSFVCASCCSSSTSFH